MDGMTWYLDGGTEFPLIHTIYNGSIIHPTSYPKDKRGHFPGLSGGKHKCDYSLPPSVAVTTCQAISLSTLHLHERKEKLPLCMLHMHAGELQVQLFITEMLLQQ
jgi:hypothetical protein